MKSLFLLCLCALLSGCYIGQGRFPIVSNKPLNLADLTIDKEPTAINQFATSVSLSLFNMQFADGATMDQSMDKILDKTDSDIVKNAHLKTTILFLPFITTIIGWEVTGNTYDVQE